MPAPLTRILYVEDEPDIQAVAKLALEAVGGYTVHACSSGRDALQAMEEFRPQLALLDVMMPGMDGPAKLEQLRLLPHGMRLPVVFMTAKVQPEEVLALKKLGALAVIPKPFDPLQLAAQVNAIWERDQMGQS
ncbi:response regulator [Chitinimonas lacunae]|uniref:Response regulator n=1 Tax=Chitinimonas lacunae TaxID=1963018 RepID=A0ABV8MQ23_9NEIS